MLDSNVYNVDCVEFMSTIPTRYFDLSIVDPPYGIGESSKNHESRNTPITQKSGVLMKAPKTTYKKKNWDAQAPNANYFSELKRVSKNCIIFGANYFAEICGVPFKAPRRDCYQEFLSQNPFGWIVWDKVNGNNDFNDCELIFTSFDRESCVLPFMWNGMMQAKSIHEPHVMQGNKKLNEKRIHPTQKPIPLYRKLLLDYAAPKSKVFDSHMGSQSSRIAADIEGVNYTGCEIDVDIYQDGCKRYNQHKISARMF